MPISVTRHSGNRTANRRTFRYVPVLLGGVFKRPAIARRRKAFAGIRNKPEYERLETQRFIARHGITTFRRNPFFPVNTLGLMRGAVAARRHGISNVMWTRCFVTCGRGGRNWMIRRDAGSVDESGLDGREDTGRPQTQEVKDELLANTQNSVDARHIRLAHIFRWRAIFFGKDRLRDVEDTIAAAGNSA